MPNWVINRIYITGPEDKIKEFEDKVIDKSEDAENTFSFSRICPSPEELINTTSPDPKPTKQKIKNENGEEVEVEVYQMFLNSFEIESAISKGETPPDPILLNNATPAQRDSLVQKYGESNWRDWNVSNWGTKWDASWSSYSEEDRMLQFSTAWSCPSAGIQKMAEMFPDLTFEGTYADEDFGCNAGQIIDGGTFPCEDQSPSAYETGAELWELEGYFDLETGEWIFENDRDDED